MSDAWVVLTAGCASQEYVKLVPVTDKNTKVTRVLSCIGPRESWYEMDRYEYVVYQNNDNRYSVSD